MVRTRTTGQGNQPPVLPARPSRGRGCDRGRGRGRGLTRTTGGAVPVDPPVAPDQVRVIDAPARLGITCAYCDSWPSGGPSSDFISMYWPCSGGLCFYGRSYFLGRGRHSDSRRPHTGAGCSGTSDTGGTTSPTDCSCSGLCSSC